MKRKFVLMVSMLLTAAILIAACAPVSTQVGTATPPLQASAPAAQPGSTAGNDAEKAPVAKIAIVFNQLGDLSMNDMGYEGIKRAQEELGIAFDYVECPSETEAETQLRMFATDGIYDLVMIMGANRLDAVQTVASEFPDQRFSIVDSAVPDGIGNLRGTMAHFPETTFLSGVLAGLVTIDDRMPFANKENCIGFAGGMDSPTSKAGAAGFFAGVKYVNPACEILYTIVGSYNDPGKAKEIALTSIGRGADMMSVNCGASATGVVEAVQEKDIYFIGSSYGVLDKEHSLATTFTAYEQFVYQEAEAIVNGTWKSGTAVKGIADKVCDCSFEGIALDIPDDIKQKIEAVRKNVIDGKITLPEKPEDVDEWAKNNQFAG